MRSKIGLRTLFICPSDDRSYRDLWFKNKKNEWRLRHSYWTVLIRFHKGPKMLIWHCTDFVQLLDCNLDDIKTVITGPSRFMCSLIQSKAPSCFANGTHPFPPPIFYHLFLLQTPKLLQLPFPKKIVPSATYTSCTAADMDLFWGGWGPVGSYKTRGQPLKIKYFSY